MTISIFKSKWKFYKVWLSFTGTLKKTKKDCWLEYKQERSHYQAPAKLTPKIISETYDAIKKFLDDYYEPHKEEWWSWVIVSTSDKAEYSFHSRCKILVLDSNWMAEYDSNNHVNYSPRRRICLAFFDDVKCKDPDTERFCVDAQPNELFEKWTHTSWDEVLSQWEQVQTEELSEDIPF